MVDVKLRQELSQDIRPLVTGRMTNDEFDDVYFDRYSESPDRGVERIAEFGYCLYSSDTLWPYRLSGRHAIDCATRRTVARCVLFLRSGLPYEWPPLPGTFLSRLIYGSAFSLGIPTGIILLVLSVPYLLCSGRDFDFWCRIALLGGAILAISIWYAFDRTAFRSRRYSPEWEAWQNTGDYDVWPFRRREEFYQARRTNFLLGTR